MRGIGNNISLTPLNDIFSVTKNTPLDEVIQEIELKNIRSFKNHPFKVLENNEMNELVESVKELGVLVPVIVRPISSNTYEMVSGHRRLKASILAEKSTISAIIRELDDDSATLLMIDANLQRENILPSERAKAYRMKMDALKHQGKATSSQVGTKSRADEEVAKEEGISRNQVQRFIRLTFLIDELLDHVDKKQLAFNCAVEISYLEHAAQAVLLEFLEDDSMQISLAQAMELKKLSKDRKLDRDTMFSVLNRKKAETYKIVLQQRMLESYFPASYTREQMERTIFDLLEEWKKDN